MSPRDEVGLELGQEISGSCWRHHAWEEEPAHRSPFVDPMLHDRFALSQSLTVDFGRPSVVAICLTDWPAAFMLRTWSCRAGSRVLACGATGTRNPAVTGSS